MSTTQRAATAILGAALLIGAWMVLGRGLLVEPVLMDVLGECLEADGPCTRVRCVFENQGPVPSRAQVIVDTWRGVEDAYDYAGVRRILSVSLAPGERADHTLEVVGVPYAGASTMVRCMPGYVAGGYPLKERPLR